MSIFHLIFKNKLARTSWGNIILILFLMLIAIVMLLPFIYTMSTSLKPSNELWLFPPRFFVRHPTFKNFTDLFNLMSNSWVPFSRYIFNTVFITVVGTVGHILIASMCAYPISKYKFPGSTAFFNLVQTTLMFSAAVTAIPSFIIISKLHILNTYMAIILPALGLPLGLFIMKQFMDQTVNFSVLESAEIDGANEWQKFFWLVMPMVKPAWLTLMIFSVQSLWALGNTPYIYSEQLKTLPFAMSQIQTAGIARAGVGAAASVLIMSVPLIIFILSQSNIIETMSTSGMKD
jgi:ABC-type glycerol-3-phosphate transport system permease component